MRTLVVSAYTDEELVLGAFRAGARGYITRNCTCRELEEAIRAVHRGRTWISPEIAHHVAFVQNHHRSPDGHDRLTPRERQVLQLAAEGYTSKEIADVLGISERTVNTHRFRLKQKLGLHRSSELFRYAVSHRLIEVSGVQGLDG